MDKKDDEMREMLDDLTDIIKKVYLPLMRNRQDQRLHMEQFVRHSNNSMEQAYGNVTIVVPELPDKSNEEIQQNQVLINQLIDSVESWTVTIKDTVQREAERQPDRTSATGQTEYWRQRNATFNTLYQQLNLGPVKRIKQILQNTKEQDNESTALDEFNQQYGLFIKLQAQARDYVKFLTTLNRQFSNIAKGDLQLIEETLPSLLTGLKLIWTISRHIYTQESKFEEILASISYEICDKVKAQIDIQKIFQMKRPEDALKMIKQGIEVLQKWRKEFLATKKDIEDQQTGVRKWDFQTQKDIFAAPIYMVQVLEDLAEAHTIIQEFFAILGPDLKQVTGSAKQIDDQIDTVREQVKKLEQFPHDVFKEAYKQKWKTQFEDFKKSINHIDSTVRDLIGNTFSKQLNSSESAFDLLSKFQNVRTRETIKKLLKEKYDDVLRQYDKELTKNEILFEEGRENPPISKNMPMQAGRIAWARSIMGRIKAPIKKFKTKSDQLFGVGPIFKDVATKYVKLAKELDKNYEQKIFKNWQEVNTNKAIEHLQQHILKRKKTADYNVYTVNFAPELKVTIREAKFLSRIGKPIPQTIINIALQEKDYMRHVDKLNQLLRNYTQAVSDLRPVERRLLRNDIEKLDKHMDKGYANHNWFSLSIDEYIKECRTAIDTFKETKNNVKGHSNNIDKQVNKIENSQIIKQIDFERAQPMDISEFTEYFESHRQLMISDLVKDYQFIGDNYLKSIEECTVKNTSNDSGKSEAMKPYYAYWERRIFNAITKMIVRALAANFTLYKRNEKPFLIRMTSSYNPPDIQFHPTCDELKSALDKFNRNILDSAKQFGRWWDGFARIFEEKTNEETGEKSIPFTFHDDIKTNKMIVQMSFDIIQQQTQIMDKFGMISGHYTNKKGPMYRLFDKQEMTKMQKLIEKNQSTKEIERRILTIKGLLDQQMKKDQEQNNYIVLIDNSDLHHKTIDKIKEWLEILGDSLKNIASKQLKQIVEQTSKYNKELQAEMQSIELLKILLKVISEIKDISMDMEFKIVEVQEQFRMLTMYEYEIEPEIQEQVDTLMTNWEELMDFADRRNFEVNDFKQNYSAVTKEEVKGFQQQIKEEYEKYLQKGPGTSNVTLEEGVELLKESKEKIAAFNKKREENVSAEKLFELEISKYPELIAMEESNKKYDQIYNVYIDYDKRVQEFSAMSWTKMDPSQLIAAAEQYYKIVMRLGTTLEKAESMHPYNKLKDTIFGFKESLPLIEMLRHPAILERHWKRIMEETGKDLGDINLRSMTLSKVFQLELENYEDKVTEICIEAKEEAKNEENLQKIEQAWKITNFTVGIYVKNGIERGHYIGSVEEISQTLEDNILILQSLAASKYVRAIKSRVAQWEKDLNTIADVKDQWLKVQTQWQYLENIFSSDDIKMQLPDEAKKFGKTDQAFKKIMEAVYKVPNVLQACVKADNGSRGEDLKNIAFELDRCQKSLTNYLETKQMSFPRFYFISNDDLLQILGSSDPQTIQPFLLSLFDGCKRLLFENNNKVIVGMESDEGEKYRFETPLKPEGKIEEWMNKVDEEMKATLKVLSKKAVFHYARTKRTDWIEQQIGMVALAGTQIWWTFSVEDVFNRVAKGDKHALKDELKKESDDLNDLIALVRTDIGKLLRKAVNTLIILDVHARDIVDRFVRDSIMSAKEFAWESQLRFYWDKDEDDLVIRQCTGTFFYCYEYQGLNGRLVITPLTDRCVMTLTTALTFYLGGAPAGPAGTGKTETVKDLAKGLALRCVVTNCGETLDSVAMSIIFSGLIQTGFWGCFDEFNRINVEVLSVVSEQIQCIQMGLIKAQKKIVFQETEMRLIPSIGIFITMNPGYAGRSELPDNLKALFRPVTMVVPNLQMICENMLMSEGFTQAKVLAVKMTTLYKLSKEQLSKQYHYDFGLRALKSVLVMAGSLKRNYSDLPEDIVLMRALRDMNMPKFVFEDVPLFQGLINDLFPGIKAERVGYEDLNKVIIEILDAVGCHHSDEESFLTQVDKIVQLYETMLTRHTTMVVGPTGAGKSVIIDTLAKALKDFLGSTTVRHVINPKMVTLNELYGVLDPDSRDWTDGLLSRIFKDINVDLVEGKPEQRWIIYDGDVDAVWVENMNSVMDDNKILTLANGDRIRLLSHCAMLFEVFDLQYASPATISRCGMVFVDAKNLGYAPYWERWVNEKQKKYNETMGETLRELYVKYLPPCIDRIFEGQTGGEELENPLKMITPRTNLNLIEQLCKLIDSQLPEPDQNPPEDIDRLEKFFIFCLMWSLGGCLLEDDREIFSEFVRGLSGLILPNNSLYDEYYDIKKDAMTKWDTMVSDYEPPVSKKFSEILVPTVDTVRYSWLLEQIMNLKKPACFCGESGTAKTVTVQASFAKLDREKFQTLNINMSSRTSAADFKNNFMENIDKKTFKQYGPKAAGKRMIVFIDDMNMPKIDVYGTQQPLALGLFLISRLQLYHQSKDDLELREIVDTQFVGCISPESAGGNRVDPRFMSLFSVFNCTFPSNETTQSIYNKILEKHVAEFHDDIKGSVAKITEATMNVYNQIKIKLPRTPMKFHYIFNLRDLSRVYEGLLNTTPDKFPERPQFIRLWRNECLRVFCDRLLNNEDQEVVGGDNGLISEQIKIHFKEVEEVALANPILFGDFTMSNPTDEEAEDPRLYEDLNDWSQVKTKLEKMLEDYGFDNKPMTLVLFNDALAHVTRIHRIIRFPKGCAMLVGFGGSGKQSLTKLATYTACQQLFTISLVRGYKEDNFREDLKSLYKLVLQKEQSFLFTDSHVAEEGFLELINNVLTIGMVPGLFPEEEKDGLMQPLDDEIRKKKLPETKEFRWNYFVNRARERLHIVLAMSPAGETLKVRCRNFPGLISNTIVDWFFPWPEDALTAVANNFMGKVELEDEQRDKVISHLVMVHLSVQDYSEEFKAKYKRNNYSTPKNYLDFIDNYINFLKNKRKMMDGLVKRLDGGLVTLKKAAEDTEVLSKELEEKNKVISEKSVEVEALIKDITEKSVVAGEQQAAAQTKKTQLDAEAIIIEKEEAEAREALKAAEPALIAAAEALKLVEQKDIVEIKNLASPPQTVQDVCTMAWFLMLGSTADGSWATVKLKLLGQMGLLEILKTYDVSKTKSDQAQRAKKKLAAIIKDLGATGQELQNIITTKNKATGGLYKWCSSTIECYDIYKDVEPKKKRAEQMRKAKEQGEKELAETEANLAALNKNLAELNANKKEKQDKLNELQRISAEMTRKLNAASQLITGLAGEQKRWTADMGFLEEDKIKLVGDCLTGSAFLSYCGPFNSQLRQDMIFEKWKGDLKTKELPNKEDFKLETFLTSEVEVARWASFGLPSDDLSVQNGILTTSASRWPLCIDPQLQAVSWIKNKEKGPLFEILTFNTPNYIKRLENAISFGKSVLFEGIDEELDPMIDPVLEKNIFKVAGVDMLKLGDTDVQYSQDFRMFLTTRLSNPNYTPEIFGKTMIINFNVTMLGLRDQLLNQVVEYERPELEEARKNLIIETSNNKATLKELEDTLLSELSKETDVPLVDNVPLIDTLNTAKSKSIEISAALEKAKITNADIESNRESYKGVAWRGSILFFSIQGLSQISTMYQYSLDAYNGVFMMGLETSRKDSILNNRLKNITDTLTRLIYEFVCMGIFEVHKLMYSFQMITMIMNGDNKLDQIELDFFLKGNTSLDAVESKKPYDWISDNSWKDMQKLDGLNDSWNGFIDNLRKYPKEWREWYDQEAPEQAEIPCGYSQKLSQYQILLLIKVIRQDRVINQTKKFIIDKMSDVYVKPPPINFDKIYSQSNARSPIVFILSPGADPYSDIVALTEKLGISKFKPIALGQGMEEKAANTIESGAMRGWWVMLQNCHLLVKWLKQLEILHEHISAKPDKAFRLWLTTSPTDGFPLGILQKSIKVVTEPPDGLGQNIKQTYSKLTDETFNQCPKPEFKPLLYVLSFFHATIQERKKFGKIGWNVKYDFNESDFKISYELISLYLKQAHINMDEELPWETLRYLIGNAMYGGRVTDDRDRRALECYLEEYMGDFIFDSNQKFFFSQIGGEYTIPNEESYEANLEFIDQIPIFTAPGVFGLHSNAEITYFNNAAKGLWADIMLMQTSSGGGAGGVNRDEIITNIANGILENTLPEVFDVYNIHKSFNNMVSPTQTVLLQELERFNKLTKRMGSSIKDLKRALKGEIGMSTDLDALGTAFFNGQLPAIWRKLAPQTEKNLVNWISHFERRFKQYRTWVDVEEPKVIWLSGLSIPESYGTALIQTTCRSKNWALDKSTMYTNVTKIYDAAEVTQRLDQGTYVQGMYIEGARWSVEKDCIDYQINKVLVEEMPLIQVIPVEANKLKLRGTIKTPVYITQLRSNAMGVGLVMEADLKTNKHISHWILQGVAMMLNID